MNVRLVRRASFSAAVKFPAAESQRYGAREGSDGLGCNYSLEAAFTGDIDPLSGMIVNLRDIDHWLKEVVALVDHRVLNDVEALRALGVPTPERLAQFLFAELKTRTRGARLCSLRVCEGEGFSAEFSERE